MERLSIPGGEVTGHLFRLRDRQRLRKADSQATAKEKRHCQALQLVHIRREEALREKEGITYEAGLSKFTLQY